MIRKSWRGLMRKVREWDDWLGNLMSRDGLDESALCRMLLNDMDASMSVGGISMDRAYVHNVYELHLVAPPQERDIWRQRLSQVTAEQALKAHMSEQGYSTYFELRFYWRFESTSMDNKEAWVVSRTGPTRIPTRLPPVGKFVVVSGGQCGEEFLVTTKTRIGSFTATEENQDDIRVSDAEASDIHAELQVERSGGRKELFVSDAGSTNGTFVNEKLLNNRRKLDYGDQLRVGATTLHFDLPPQFRPRLRIITGPSIFTEHEPYDIPNDGSSLIVGRGEPQDDERKLVLPPDPTMAQEHAVIEVRNGRTMIYNRDSVNGTLVNDLSVQETQLEVGDLIRIGSVVLLYSEV